MIQHLFILFFFLTIFIDFSIIAATTQQKQKYLNELMAINQKMQINLQQLKLANQNTLANSQSLKGQNTLQKIVLQQGVNVQRDLIIKTLNESIIPLQDNYWTCKDFTPSQKLLIEQKINNLKLQSKILQNQIISLNNCLRNSELKDSLALLNIHILSLQNQLKNSCVSPSRKDIFLINNVHTDKNWIYGAMSKIQYQNKIDQLKSKYNVIYCPIDKPFLINNTNTCNKCNLDSQIFDLLKSVCVSSCRNGTIFSKQNHECLNNANKIKVSSFNINNTTIPYIWGSTNQSQYNASIRQLQKNNISEICSNDKPLSVNNSCVDKCPDLYDISTKTCVSCKIGQKYINVDHMCKVIIKNINYESGKNWISNDGSSIVLDNKINQYKLINNYIVQTCPNQSPYPNKNYTNCLKCQKYYDINLLQCRDCETNQIMKDHKCIVNTNVTNGNTTNNLTNVTENTTNSNNTQINISKKNSLSSVGRNYMGNMPVYNKSLQTCTQQQPFYNININKCISCTLPSSYYNFNTNKCVKCQNNQIFNVLSKKCQNNIIIFNSNMNYINNINNYCCGQIKVDSNKQTCPQQQPYFNGLHCLSCSLPSYFNYSSNLCLKCNQNQQFHIKTKSCVKSQYLNYKYTTKNVQNLSNYYGNMPQTKPLFSGQQFEQCPKQSPYTNGKQCIKCQLPKYFNYQSNLCQICKQGYSFNPNVRQCSKDTTITPNNQTVQYYNSNLVNANNFMGIVPLFNNKYGSCEQNYRYFNGSKCIKCQLPQYYNFNTQQCLSCKQNTYFDTISKKCLYLQNKQKYVTLMSSNNIFYNGDYTVLANKVNKSLLTKCPSDKPFFDKSLNQCISCENQQLFNFIKNECIKCPNNMHFNDQLHICVQNKVQPTLQRMVMNSINWI